MSISLKLDAVDRAILGSLARNCRITNASLATALRVSKDTIAYRIERLEHEQILAGYVLFIDARTLGFTRYHLLIRCATTSENHRAKYARIAKHPCVMWINSFVGKFDFQVIVDATSPFELDEIRQDIFALCKSPIQDYMVLTHLSDLEFTQLLPDTSKILPIEKKDDGSFSHLLDAARFPVSNSFSRWNADPLDVQILEKLAADPRVSISDLERSLSTERITIRRRILGLIQGKVILSFGGVPSVQKLGYVTYYLLVRLNHNVPEVVLQKTFQSLGNVFYAGRMTGNYDMVLYLNARTPQELNESIANFRGHLSKYILTYDLLVQESIHYWKQFTTGIRERLLRRVGKNSLAAKNSRFV